MSKGSGRLELGEERSVGAEDGIRTRWCNPQLGLSACAECEQKPERAKRGGAQIVV